MKSLGKTLVLALGIVSHWVADAIVPEVGSTLSGVTQVADYIVPVPSLAPRGMENWTVIGAGSKNLPMATGSKDSATGFFPVEYVVLANVTPRGEIAGVISLEATVSFENTSFGTPPLSALKNTFYTNQFYSNSPARGKPSLSYLATHEMKAGDFGSEFESFLEHNHINFPTDLIFKVAYDQVAAGRYLKANIFLFPGALMGVDVNPEAMTLGTLRPDRAYLRGPIENTLLSELLEWTKALEPLYQSAFNNPGDDTVGEDMKLPPLGGMELALEEEQAVIMDSEMIISDHGKVVQDFMGQTAIDAMRVVEQAEKAPPTGKKHTPGKKAQKTPLHTVAAPKGNDGDDQKVAPEEKQTSTKEEGVPEGTMPAGK